MMETAYTAIKSIMSNKTRSALTMLGIIIGVAAVILLVSLGQGLQNYITGQFEALGTNIVVVLPGRFGSGDGEHEGGFGPQSAPNFAGSKFTLADVEDLSRLPRPVEDVGAGIETPATVSYLGEAKYTTIGGLTPEFAEMRNFTAETGRMITKGDERAQRKVTVLGKSVVEDLFGQSDPVGKQVTIGEQNFEVIGTLSEFGSGGFGIDIDSFVIIPITTAQSVFGIDSVQEIAVKAESPETIDEVIDLVEANLARKYSQDDFSVIDQGNLLATITQILGVITAALGGIAAISLVVGGVGIMNIMLVSVTERTREIGLRKAVGAKPRDIRNQFLIEAVVLSTLGGLIGILVGAGGALALRSFIATSVSIWSVALAFGVSAGVGIIFGVAPAIRASKLNPIDALRYE